MSYFDDASLVMIPSGYKTSKVYSVKPTDGTGDLTFTRSNDTATRVGPNGLIEKVRTNLILQSNTFDTTWTNTNSTETSGQAGYDGTNNAWLLSKSAASGKISQTISTSTLVTFSLYVKAGTLNWIATLFDGISGGQAYFDLQNGVVGSRGAGVLNHTITLVSGGWYRVTTTTSSAPSGISIFPADANNNVTGTSGNIYIQDAQLETGDIATDYIATTTAAVSVGPVANVPRLDYLGSSCPRLLLEPQRTNIQPYSENFDNSAWTKQDSTITANVTTSPDGYQNADELKVNTTTTFHQVAAVQSVVSGTTYSYSVYAKQGSGTKFLQFAGAGLQVASQAPIFDLQNGVAYTAVSKTVCLSADIQSVGNGWYRCSAVISATGATGMTLCFVGTTNAFSGDSFAGNGTDSFYIWGAQVEAGTYATSYIPTLGAAVTRGADAASKTGISSLIGQTEGTIFVEFNSSNVAGSSNSIFGISNGTTSSRALIYLSSNRIDGQVRDASATQAVFTGITMASNTNYKCAIAYKANDVAFYINGTQIGLDTSATIPAMSDVRFDSGGGATTCDVPVNQALLFKTRLTNAQLAELTTL